MTLLEPDASTVAPAPRCCRRPRWRTCACKAPASRAGVEADLKIGGGGAEGRASGLGLDLGSGGVIYPKSYYDRLDMGIYDKDSL